MALTRISNQSLTSVTALPAAITTGKILQIVQGTSTTEKSTTGTSFVDTHLSATITPSSTSSKILLSCTQIIQVYKSGGSYGTGRWKIVQTIGGTSTDVTVGGDSSNGNVFCFDYGSNGINIYRPTNYTRLLSPSTTSAITYKTQIAKGSNGGTAIYAFDGKDTGTMVLLEVE